MPHIQYWSPGAGSTHTSLGNDDHYLRLGAYVGTQEPADANIAEGDVAQGIYFYTSGKYSLKATLAMHQAVDGPVIRTVKTGDLSHTNNDGSLSITATEGGVTMTAEKKISISSSQDTGDDAAATTITIDAGSNNVYFQQGKYEKTVTDYEEKIVKAYNHKTNIGLLINAHSGAGVTTSVSLELTYSTASVGVTGLEVSTKGIALSYETLKNTFVPLATVSFTLVEGKKVFLDQEFCVVKNETRVFRFTQGIAQALIDESCVRSMLATMDEKAIIAEFKKYNIVI